MLDLFYNLILKSSFKKTKTFLLIVALAGLTQIVSGANSPVIAVVFDARYQVYSDIFLSFRKTLIQDYVRVIKTSFQSTDSDEEILKRINNVNPTHIFCIGSKASRISSQLTKPGVFTMVKPPLLYELIDDKGVPTTMLTGILIDQEGIEKYSLLKKIVGTKNKLGIIYSDKSKESVESAEMYAKEVGFNVYKHKVETPNDVIQSLPAIQKNANVMLSFRDTVVFNRKTIATMLRFSVTNKIPIVGFIETMTKKGCMVSFHPNADLLGKRSALLIRDIINNASKKYDPVKKSDVSYSINKKFCKLFNFKVSKEIEKNASNVF